MHISILGGSGFLGRKLALRLAATGQLGNRPIDSLTLFDLVPAAAFDAPFPVHRVTGELTGLPQDAIPPGTDVVFHLAAVVSAAAEADYDLGRRVNLRGTDAVVDACRLLSAPPRLVFTSTVASFCGGQAATIDDADKQVPANSYGAQKAASELILADATRRGFLDAVSLRMPTVIVRPGRPNMAASSFVSAILREPLLGLRAELPVSDDFAVWVCSPNRAVEWLMHAAVLDTAPLGLDRGLNLPGISSSIARMLGALETVRPGASVLIDRVENPAVEEVVSAWPAAFAAVRAQRLGFREQERLVDVVEAFIADDLEATRQDRAIPA